MRELKFRAKIKNSQFVPSERNNKGWICGELHSSARIPHIHPLFNCNISFPIIRETIGQYIGIKDRNGVEVYEGDIVEMHYFGIGMGNMGGATETDNFVKGVICWDSVYCCFFVAPIEQEHITENFPFTLMEDPIEELEVIGNIHDNAYMVK